MSLSVQTHPNRSLVETARHICESRGGKWSGTKGMACCPAHDDRTPSLGVSLGRQAILFHCFAGCDQQSVLWQPTHRKGGRSMSASHLHAILTGMMS